MKPFKVFSREILLNEKYCQIEKQIVEFPNKKKGEWFIQKSNDAVIIIPKLQNGDFVLQKNYKHGSGKIITEFCAGLIDDGETPLQAGIRELEEETGLVAEKLEFLGKSLANPTSSNMKYHFFLAKNCEFLKSQKLDSAEQIETFSVKNVENLCKTLLDKKTETSSATLAGLSFLLNYK